MDIRQGILLLRKSFGIDSFPPSLGIVASDHDGFLVPVNWLSKPLACESNRSVLSSP
jgi:hypothetical protein